MILLYELIFDLIKNVFWLILLNVLVGFLFKIILINFLLVFFIFDFSVLVFFVKLLYIFCRWVRLLFVNFFWCLILLLYILICWIILFFLILSIWFCEFNLCISVLLSLFILVNVFILSRFFISFFCVGVDKIMKGVYFVVLRIIICLKLVYDILISCLNFVWKFLLLVDLLRCVLLMVILKMFGFCFFLI